MKSFQLFTSIKPPTNACELSYLNDCLNSWRIAGFTPVTVNGPKEAEALQRLDLGIECASLPGDGKPRIGTILSAIRESGVKFSGIINSDCKVVGYPNLASNLRAGLESTVALAWRIDLGSDLEPAKRRGGFDAFFFDTNIIPTDDCGFSIAEPWWDYWFPIACEMNGAKVETLSLPLLTHKSHPENWDDKNWIDAGHRVWETLQNWHRRGDLPESLLARVSARLRFGHIPSNEQLRYLASVPPFWLFDCRPQSIAVMAPEVAEIEAMLRFGGRSLFNEVKFAQFEDIRDATFWRLTAPARAAVIAARRIIADSGTKWSQIRRWFGSSD